MSDKTCIYNKIWGNFKLKLINDRHVNVKLNIFLWTFLHVTFCVWLWRMEAKLSYNNISVIFMHYLKNLGGKVYIRFSTVKDPQNALLLCRLSSKRQLPLVGITSENPCELCLRILFDRSWLLYWSRPSLQIDHHDWIIVPYFTPIYSNFLNS